MNLAARPRRFAAFRTIRGRILFWVLAVTIPIYAAALYMSYQATAQRLEQGAARDADELAARLAAGLDTVIRPIEGGIRTVARQLEEVNPPPEQYAARIHGILAAWPEVYGSTIAVEVHADEPGSRPFAPYYYRHGNGHDATIAYSDLALDSYGYRKLEWYRLAADGQQPVWSSPYFDAGGGETWMVTYSVPFFRKQAADQRVLGGVITADLDLEWVQLSAQKLALGPFDVGWLASPPSDHAFIAPIGATGQRMAAKQAPWPREAIRAEAEKMLAKGATFGLLPRRVTGSPTYLAVRNLETLDWRLMLVIPRHELLAEARALLERQLWLGGIGLLLLIVAISLLASGISRPIHALAEAVGSAEEGNLDFDLPEVTTRDETGVLTEALRRLRDSLKTHVQLRVESLAAQARLEHELQIAASIQQSMLPKHAPALLPPGVRLAAALVPAKQVGGDLYDYFVLRDGSLLFAVGDVSDKGVPAALFMARLSGLLRVLGSAGEATQRLLAEINSRLSEGNEACMFVTVGCGVLDVHSGGLRYASAGHDLPLLRRVDGSVVTLAAENGPAIGIETVAEYRVTECFIAPGDTLVLFTDGVTEAETGAGAQFGVERLSALLTASNGEPADIVQRVIDTVAAHSADFHAEDDLTVLAVSLRPDSISVGHDERGERWRIESEASADGVHRMQRWLHGILAARDVAPGRIADVELIAEEVLTNVVRSATGGAHHRLAVDCALPRGEILLTFSDDAAPFDPLARATPPLEADIAERGIGGLGIHLVRELADHIHYSHVDGRNVLAIRLRLTSA